MTAVAATTRRDGTRLAYRRRTYHRAPCQTMKPSALYLMATRLPAGRPTNVLKYPGGRPITGAVTSLTQLTGEIASTASPASDAPSDAPLHAEPTAPAIATNGHEGLAERAVTLEHRLAEAAARTREERTAREEQAGREAEALAAREAEALAAACEADEHAAREELAAREAEARAAREELTAREADERAVREAEELAALEAREARAAREAEAATAVAELAAREAEAASPREDPRQSSLELRLAAAEARLRVAEERAGAAVDVARAAEERARGAQQHAEGMSAAAQAANDVLTRLAQSRGAADERSRARDEELAGVREELEHERTVLGQERGRLEQERTERWRLEGELARRAAEQATGQRPQPQAPIAPAADKVVAARPEPDLQPVVPPTIPAASSPALASTKPRGLRRILPGRRRG